MLKAFVRKIIGNNHWEFLSWYRDRFGTLATIKRFFKLTDTVAVPTTISSGSVLIRPGTADLTVYEEVFIRKEYELPFEDPRVIVDAGAHIGLSAVFFAIKYPDALIVALEPEDSNYELLMQNTLNFPNIHPVKGGLWSSKCHLNIINPDAASWSFRVEESQNGSGIDAYSIDYLMSMFSLDAIDILKMDIEGSEKEVLFHCQSWIEKVHSLVIETHDRYVPGCSELIEEILSARNFSKEMSGEKLVYRAKKRLGS